MAASGHADVGSCFSQWPGGQVIPTAEFAQQCPFQDACRDAARRVGLFPSCPNPAKRSTPKSINWTTTPLRRKKRGDRRSLATGYLYQGQIDQALAGHRCRNKRQLGIFSWLRS